MHRDYYNFGYHKLGPLLLGFSHWLNNKVREEGIEKIYFFSRDGFIMKQSFDLLFRNENIKTFYLEVSRRSLRVPILWKNCTFENLLTMLGPSELITLQSVFDCVGLSMSEYGYEIKKYGFNKDSFFYRSNILDNQKLLSLYDDLFGHIRDNSLTEYKYLKQYLQQNDLKGKFAIVDIGWSGGMQRFLQTTLKEMSIDADIYGYYTGVADYYKRNFSDENKLNMNGYLFDFSHNSNDDDCRSCFVGLYEMLFLETRGSVKRYRLCSDGNICAERYEYEYMVNGNLLEEVNCIKELQDGAISFIKDNIGSIYKEIEIKKLSQSLLSAGQKPEKEAIRLFSNFRFFDEGELQFLARPKSLFYYLLHFDTLKEDFLKSRWKTAFLRKLFKIPISYYGVYIFLRKFQNRCL